MIVDLLFLRLALGIVKFHLIQLVCKISIRMELAHKE